MKDLLLPRPADIKNKNPAVIQITAEQILREAKERQEQPNNVAPKQRISGKEELDTYQQQKRREFENIVRRNRTAVGAWLKYAAWEEKQDELERARSIFERALEFEHRSQVIWLKYAEMEMKNKNVNRARNVYDRAVAILPKVDVFWYKYTYMEELLDNPAGARQVFERWMQWEPTEEAWMAYVKFEQRYKEYERARLVFKRFVSVYPQPKNWIKWSKFEEGQRHVDAAREIYEQCISTLGEEFIDQNVYISFAKFETRQKEIDRARAIYQYALDKLPEGLKENLFNEFTLFEKQFGTKDELEDVVVAKRRLKYEDELQKNSHNYDIWFDYIRLEESGGRPEKIRQIYERAIAQVPLVGEKRYWRRYIYIWIFYAVWEELEAKDMDRTKQVYLNALKIIPHKHFTFAKIWNLYARFLVRQHELTAARKQMGKALGICPKEKIFKDYITLELSLREFDRARTLYQKYLEWNPTNCAAWIKFAELERMLGDTERARGIFEIAIKQGELDLPEVLWKAYLDFEVDEEEWEKARELYTRLLDRTSHVKVQISFANFEFTALDNGSLEKRIEAARARFEKSNDWARSQYHKEDRVLLLESWLNFEKEHGDEGSIQKVQNKLPKAVKKRRRVMDEAGNAEGWEEYYDYVFPEDDNDKSNVKLLEIAHQWKEKMAALGSSDEDSDEE
ncbi:Crooked neck-like protein 1 [Boothiomyces sp. JEL0838]|nr:Crooked neck-like protein 1 [Boothiomyces sp. JEL0838]